MCLKSTTKDNKVKYIIKFVSIQKKCFIFAQYMHYYLFFNINYKKLNLTLSL